MNNPLLAIQSQYWAVRDYLSPVLKESKFKEHGRITPEEFVAAGDFLSYKFPVWQWEKGEPNRARDFLPPDKQYLITRNVPCLRRANALAYTDAEEDSERLLNFMDDAEEAPGPDGKTLSDSRGKGGEDDWVETHVGRASTAHHSDPTNIADIPDLEESSTPDMSKLNISSSSSGGGDRDIVPTSDEIPDMDDIPDMDEGEGMEEVEDVAAARAPIKGSEAAGSGGNLLQVRTYDCLISYDKHYQTPRFWLLGYDENKKPLTPQQVFEDVPSDHAFKTMTMETFPHSGQLLASVHPCKHASVMKKFIDRMDAAQTRSGSPDSTGRGTGGGDDGKKKQWGIGKMVRKVTGGVQTEKEKKKEKSGEEEGVVEETGLQVDFYLVIFLKFIASIVPTIEVDSTTAF